MLRLHASHGAKTTKNQTPWYVLLDYFIIRPSFKNLKVRQNPARSAVGEQCVVVLTVDTL